MIDDPKLSGISVLIFDEFHERHLYGDITLARALDLQEQHRPDLSLVVMSATLNAAELEKYLSEVRRDEFHESQTLSGKGQGLVELVLPILAAPSSRPKGGFIRSKLPTPRSRVTTTSGPSGNRPPRRSVIMSIPAARATCWSSCRVDLKFPRRSKPSATRRGRKASFYCRFTANWSQSAGRSGCPLRAAQGCRRHERR